MKHLAISTPALLAGALCAAGAAQAADQLPATCRDGYSLTDVNNDGYISMIEIEDYARVQTEKMDSDGDGSVSEAEYVNCAKAGATSKARATDRSEKTARKIDADGDGIITQEEFMKAGAGTKVRAEAGDRLAGEEAMQFIFIPTVGGATDAGAMSLDEFAARMALMFVSLDTNDDRGIDREEWQVKAPEMADISRLIGKFDDVDADSSGDLTSDEWVAIEMQRAEAARAMARKDGEKMGEADGGAPVVYYRYPHPF